MRTLFVGDVHGCSEELCLLLEQVAADRIVLLGDLFTKGPDPRGVWDLVEAHGCEAVLGNHDVYVLTQEKAWEKLGLPPEAWLWLHERPLWIAEGPWIAVHAGVHPELGTEGTTRRIATVMRSWPDFDRPDQPAWFDVYQGAELVIYGHDARRGLQDHRPATLGLDTGCVYGGALTGFLLEENRLVSVPAKRVYKAIG